MTVESSFFAPRSFDGVAPVVLKDWKNSEQPAIASNGKYLFVHCAAGLMKVGTGNGGTERGKVYARNQQFYSNLKGISMAFLEGKLYVRNPHAHRKDALLIVDTASLKETGKITVAGDGTTPSANNKNIDAFYATGGPIFALNERKLGIIGAVPEDSVFKIYAFRAPDFKPAGVYPLQGPLLQVESKDSEL